MFVSLSWTFSEAEVLLYEMMEVAEVAVVLSL
jgi:hypothetical protein